MKEIVVSNGLYPIIAQALEEMKSEQGDSFHRIIYVPYKYCPFLFELICIL